MTSILRRALAPVLLLLLPVVAHAADFEKEHRKYKAYLKRPSLQMRCRQRQRLSSTFDLRALKVLADSYPSAEAPRDMVQSYLVMLLTRDYGAEPEHRKVFAEWRAANTAPEDGWLWYRTLCLDVAPQGADALVAIARGDRGVFLRAAAIEALARQAHPAALGLIEPILAALPKDEVESAVLLESLAHALLSQAERLKEDAFEAPALALIGMLDAKDVAMRTKIVIARYLGRLFESDDRYTYAGPWINALKFARSGGVEASDDTYARPGRPTFGGIEASGDRIVYVIDMSDSMLKKLNPAELKEMRRGPVTGAAAPTAKKKRSPFADQKLLDWKKVTTRFDAAREMLKLSLQTLPKDKRFAVVFFGDEAALMDGCKGLRKATPGYVKSICKALDRIKPGPTSTDRPWGALRGATNLHGGLHRAFKVMPSGLVGAGEYVNRKTWKDGADTIFLLSDGTPTYDDWPMEDQKEPHDHAGNPESGVKHTDQPNLVFPGPFKGSWELEQDMQRLNLYRKCEIHCVGLGEASQGLLWKLADIGLGKVKMLGWDD